MPHGGLLYFLCAFGFFEKGLTVAIQTQQTVLAAVGEEAHLGCELLQPEDVRQVTWQKSSPDGEKDLASFSKHFGYRVNPEFQDKVEFKDAGLQNNSIVVRNVTERDEGCYHCLFNAYPDGALTGRTCLQLYELHEPVLHVGESDSTEELVVSCCVTGRPDPAVTLSVTQQDLLFSNRGTVSVSNANGTVTVTATAVLTGYRKNGTQVGCAGRVLSAPQTKVFVMIPAAGRTYITTIFPVVAFCASAIIAVLLRKKPQNSLSLRDLEMDELPQTTSRDAQRSETPSAAQENNELRQRTPPKKQQSIDIKLSPSTVKVLDLDEC